MDSVVMLQKAVFGTALMLIVAIGNCMGFDMADGVLTLHDGDKNVLSYRFGDQLLAGVETSYTRSCYIHPLYSLDGEPITDDFPRDHFHHRGVFWTWPIVKTRGVNVRTWQPSHPTLRQQFARWGERRVENGTATFTVENNWVLRGKENVAREMVTITAHPRKQNGRAIDIELKLEAVGGPLTLQGEPAEKKGYGGFCLRAAPDFTKARMLSDTGEHTKDVVNEKHKWMDISTTRSGVAIFTAADHPGYQLPWLARNSYAGFLNPSWPGLPSVTLEPGKPVELRYRILVHSGHATAQQIQAAYEEFVQSVR